MVRRHFTSVFIAAWVLIGGLVTTQPAWGIEVGDKAPEFTLPGTSGEKISLSQFRGKKLVLLEFYGADFAPV
jgi:peroxiredoxin